MDRGAERVLLMADDLGRLRRSGVESHAFDRLCFHLDTFDAMLRPTAARLYQAGMPVQRALAVVDGQRSDLLRRMGLTSPDSLL